MNNTIDIWALNQNTEEFTWIMLLEEIFVFSFDNFDTKISSFGLNDCLGCHKDFFINKELDSFSFVQIVSHVQSFSSSTGLIKQRGVTYL